MGRTPAVPSGPHVGLSLTGGGRAGTDSESVDVGTGVGEGGTGVGVGCPVGWQGWGVGDIRGAAVGIPPAASFWRIATGPPLATVTPTAPAAPASNATSKTMTLTNDLPPLTWAYHSRE